MTKSLAEYIAKYLITDIYEIQAETPYNIEDLDYHAAAIQSEVKRVYDFLKNPVVTTL